MKPKFYSHLPQTGMSIKEDKIRNLFYSLIHIFFICQSKIKLHLYTNVKR